ncbi:hypothetical protein [Xenorhabdus szentirmaii]|uniref:Uncharacterized protein n=1 Tax=Xenorhabdus szentirmaii DSM 16338 TaxID=1427518 RepID=W1J7M3_9GAMM|nr:MULTISPECIES: hypothetical protein [Xenorhabdus]MBD2822492.1 hypothetical protein [Xenorhabdus sp. 42]PHM32131.1 hypothetical protein Xsze_02861 [Xenorhabdus szentirmaii DSM 16338]PHM41577.1 hypothetical protein Xszus_01270 [Xenorhabdus szentirmaii]CDL85475.1 conserved hypothetical protein [Xenorhabdus szentirmaii DSM 16338]
MSQSLYVYCTLSNDQNYAVRDGAVFIHGQANIMTKAMHTPRGRVTEVSAEAYAQLKDNHVFQLHKENGYITVESRKADPEKVASDMEASDQSAPDTPESLEAGGKEPPKTNINIEKGKGK